MTTGALTEEAGAPGRDDAYGWGLLDASAAVAAAIDLADQDPVPPLPQLVANPTRLDFGAFDDSLILRLANGGDGELSLIATPASPAPWLNLTPISVDAAGLGAYRVSVERAGLAPRNYTTDFVLTSTANTLVVPVSLNVAASAVTPDAGHIYVLLAAAKTGELVDVTEATPADGLYRFAFQSVPAGDYWLAATSDIDADGDTCDFGEACGNYPTSALPQVLQVGRQALDGLRFDVGYGLSVVGGSDGGANPP